MHLRHTPSAPAAVLALSVCLAVLLRVWGISELAPSGDENHYQSDVRALISSTDRMSTFRRHFDEPRHKPETGRNVGHPSLAIGLMAAAEGVVRPSITLARLVNGLLGVATGLVVYLAARRSWGPFAGASAASIALLMPLTIRYDRTVYLDPAFAFLWAVILLLLSLRPTVAVLAARGLAIGALIATKTTGLLGIPLAILSVAISRSPMSPGRKLAATVATLGVAIVVGVASADPAGYFWAIVRPSDPDYQGRSIYWYLWYAGQWQSVRYLLGIAVFLVTLPVVGLALCGVVAALKNLKQRHPLELPVLLGLAGSLPVALLHLPGLSAEHGFLIFVPTLSLLAARGLLTLPVRARYAALAVTLVLLIPFDLLYGLRKAPTPYPSYLNTPDFGRQYYQLDRSLLQKW